MGCPTEIKVSFSINIEERNRNPNHDQDYDHAVQQIVSLMKNLEQKYSRFYVIETAGFDYE